MFYKIVSLAPIAFAIVSSVAFAHVPQACYRTAGRNLDSTHATMANHVMAGEIILPETIIVASKPSTKPRAWTCGPVESNRVGGSQRTCEWR